MHPGTVGASGISIAKPSRSLKIACFESGGEAFFGPVDLSRIKAGALEQINPAVNNPEKLNWWHKTIGSMYNLTERSPEFKPVFEAAQGVVGEVSHYATDAAELAPKLLPKREEWTDITKSSVSVADNKAVAKPVFEGALMWARDAHGKPVRVVLARWRAAARALSRWHPAQHWAQRGASAASAATSGTVTGMGNSYSGGLLMGRGGPVGQAGKQDAPAWANGVRRGTQSSAAEGAEHRPSPGAPACARCRRLPGVTVWGVATDREQ